MKTIIFFILLAIFSFSNSFAQNDIEKWVEKSFDCIEKENYVCAEEALKEALRLSPASSKNGFLLANLGNIQLTLGKKDDALLSFHAAIALLPDNLTLYLSRATLYAEMDSISLALDDYNTVIKKDPEDEDALYAAGLIYIQRNDTLLAQEYFDKIIAENPHSIKGKVGHGMLNKASGNYQTAEIIFSEVLVQNPQYYFVYIQRAVVYLKLHKNAKALDDVNQYIQKYPDDEYAYFLRGQVKLQQWEKLSAYEDFLKAKSLGYDTEAVAAMIRQCK